MSVSLALDEYCGSPFWDTDRTWNTTNPDFTECFENTALLWFACGFLWLVAIFDFYFNAKPRMGPEAANSISDAPSWRPGWTWLSIAKLTCITLLIFLQVVVFCVNWFQHEDKSDIVDIFAVPGVYWVTPLILILTHFLSACLMALHQQRCIHTSGTLLIHWLLLTIVHALIFRTKYAASLQNSEERLPLILLGIILCVMVIETFLLCFADIYDSDHTRLVECNDGILREECPIARASCLSYVLFSWCTPLVRRGFRAPLSKEDLWELIPSVKSQIVFQLFNKYYGKREFGEVRGIWSNIVKPLWKTCGRSFFLAVSCKMIASLISFISPKIMGFLMDFVQEKSIAVWKGYMWALVLLFTNILMTLFLEQYFLHMFKCYVNIGTCLNLKIYRKSMRISSGAKKDKTTGEIVNLMSVDTEKLRVLIYDADAVWSTPIQITLGIVLIWNELGIAVLPGIGVLSTLIPINWALTAISSKYQRHQMMKKDERIREISEVLSGIQVIKLYAWEASFLSQIQKTRAEEIRILRKRTFVQCVIQFVFDSIPFLVSVAAFYTFIYFSGGILDPKRAFIAVSLFTLLTEPITDLPTCISALIDATVSFKRINNFLNSEEIDPNATKFEPRTAAGFSTKPPPAIEIIDGNFAWEDLSTCNWQLKDINLKIRPGRLTAIVGSVASGKSSLLSAVLGDMKYSGEVIVRGDIAYAPQVAWILNGTLRENICFGLPYNAEKYNKVLRACCLNADIEILPAGDMTEIGEKGINLSGGQKQRVSLARLAYSGAEILLLDDVLSAVDSHVARNIFDRLVGPNGILAGKTRVLCTHAYNFLSQMDHIVVIEDGKISEEGNYSQLINSGGKFAHHLINLEQTSSIGNGNDGEGDHKKVQASPSKFESKPGEKEVGKLIEEEHLETGDVKLSVFRAYVKAMGHALVFCFVIFFAFSEGLALARNVVLGKWAEANSEANNINSTVDSNSTIDNIIIPVIPEKFRKERRQFYAIEYGIFGVGQSFFYLIGFFLLAIASLRATRLLHNKMLKRILRAPMSFFNVTPLGRIVNRFSSDVESLDKNLPNQIGDWICHIFKFLGILIALCLSNYYFAIFIIPLFLIYYVLQRHYILCMQQLQRILNVQKSPIYAQFQETLNGTSTVRAYKAEDRFSKILGTKIDTYNRTYLPHLIVRRWLSIRLGVLGSVVIFINALFAVIWRSNASMVGLSVSYSLQLIGILGWLVKVTSYLQYNFVSVERILEYTQVPQENFMSLKAKNRDSSDGLSAGGLITRPALTPSWPENGSIIFEDYETRYRPELDLVLRHFSCTINAGEKIGIVGRTGAGKSSLTLALFRIIERSNGAILIDGIDIADISLHELRKRLTVIPQDSVLFARSLRQNLDPFGVYEDETIWESLKLSHLGQFIENQAEGLDFQIAEGGENLSVGQRQLLCLARAILRKSSILILDEATASVDTATDDLIQQTIREHFDGCTILNVAHRLKTVLDSSRILVMSHGEIQEFDTPQALLSNPSSQFYGMAKDAGII